MLLDLLLGSLLRLGHWLTNPGDAGDRRRRRQAEIDRVNAWLRTQPNANPSRANRPKQEEPAP